MVGLLGDAGDPVHERQRLREVLELEVPLERVRPLRPWFAILLTGRFPCGIFDYLVGVGRWTNRVTAYAFILVTDQYPPSGCAHDRH